MEGFVLLLLVLFWNAVQALVFSILGGWAFMLLMGVVHLHVFPVVPAIGYGTSYALMVLLSWVVMFLSTMSTSGNSD